VADICEPRVPLDVTAAGKAVRFRCSDTLPCGNRSNHSVRGQRAAGAARATKRYLLRLAASLSVVAAIVTLLTMPVSAQRTGDGENDAADEIRNHERLLADAMHARDRRQLEQLLAPDYVLRGSPDISRTEWLQTAVTLCWGNRSAIDAFHAREYGDVVVASLELTFYTDPTSCRPALMRSLITDVWVRRSEGWQLQVRSAAPPPVPGAGVLPQYGIIPAPQPLWEVSSELSLVATAGNTETQTLGVGSTAIHRADGANSRIAMAFVTSEAQGVTNARSLNLQARHGVRQTTSRRELFAEGTFTRDRFSGIESRATLSGGIGYTARLARPHTLSAEASVGFTTEHRLEAIDLNFATATGAVHYTWRLRPGTTLTQDTALSADLTAADNWRSTSATVVSVAMTRLLSLKASHTIEYRNTPVPGFRRTDMQTAAAIVLAFRRTPPVR
jgi:putative salt-induced outer membrane protein YdiY